MLASGASCARCSAIVSEFGFNGGEDVCWCGVGCAVFKGEEMFVVADCCDVPVPEGGFVDEGGEVCVGGSLHPEDAPWSEGCGGRVGGEDWREVGDGGVYVL